MTACLFQTGCRLGEHPCVLGGRFHAELDTWRDYSLQSTSEFGDKHAQIKVPDGALLAGQLKVTNPCTIAAAR